MKKLFLFILTMLLLPCILTMGASLISDQIQIGGGVASLKQHLMGKNIQIEVHGLYKNVDVEEYVLGVMAGSISPDYGEETLKLQAILIRTNVLKEMEEQGSSQEDDLSYQYLTVEDRIALWGNRNYEKYEANLEKAVAATAGQVVVYENALILALYHDVSIGMTASAKEIMGVEIPYLVSVDSSQDVEAKYYTNVVTYSWEDFAQVLGLEQNTNQEEAAWQIQIADSTQHGFVNEIKINDVTYTGEEMMELLGLTSTNFYVEEQEDGVRFVCLGKGNCLGVSLYGANCMALEGKKAEEIISYYYQDVSVVSYDEIPHSAVTKE